MGFQRVSAPLGIWTESLINRCKEKLFPGTTLCTVHVGIPRYAPPGHLSLAAKGSPRQPTELHRHTSQYIYIQPASWRIVSGDRHSSIPRYLSMIGIKYDPCKNTCIWSRILLIQEAWHIQNSRIVHSSMKGQVCITSHLLYSNRIGLHEWYLTQGM